MYLHAHRFACLDESFDQASSVREMHVFVLETMCNQQPVVTVTSTVLTQNDSTLTCAWLTRPGSLQPVPPQTQPDSPASEEETGCEGEKRIKLAEFRVDREDELTCALARGVDMYRSVYPVSYASQ